MGRDTASAMGGRDILQLIELDSALGGTCKFSVELRFPMNGIWPWSLLSGSSG